MYHVYIFNILYFYLGEKNFYSHPDFSCAVISHSDFSCLVTLFVQSLVVLSLVVWSLGIQSLVVQSWVVHMQDIFSLKSTIYWGVIMTPLCHHLPFKKASFSEENIGLQDSWVLKLDFLDKYDQWSKRRIYICWSNDSEAKIFHWLQWKKNTFSQFPYAIDKTRDWTLHICRGSCSCVSYVRRILQLTNCVQCLCLDVRRIEL